MSGYPFFFGAIPAGDLRLNAYEVAARLGTSRDFSDERIDRCREALWDVLDCRFVAALVPVSFPETDTVDCPLGRLDSHALYRNLHGCREAFVFAVTTGVGVDRLLQRQSLLSAADHFITDALGSAAAEAACEQAVCRLSEGKTCRPRFSPGFGDLPLSVQPRLLELVDARRKLGITLNKSLLMSPMKSITAIMGVEP